MPHINIEIKARCEDPEKVRSVLKSLGADFKGMDHQIDTYFEVTKGRLKLREGNIERALIHYDRPNQEGPKQSDVTLCPIPEGVSPKEVLVRSHEVLAVVDKRRGIYFIDNVKFHVDEVEGLGSFVEIEAIDRTGAIGRERLMEQCQHYLRLLGINDVDLLAQSYSDMLMAKKR